MFVSAAFLWSDVPSSAVKVGHTETVHMNKKSKKRKDKGPSKPRILSLGWGTYFVVGAALVVIIWFVANPFMNPEAHVLGRFVIVLGAAAVLSGVVTYLLNSILGAWSRHRRRRS